MPHGKEKLANKDYVICIWKISFTTVQFLSPDSPRRAQLCVRTVWARDVNHCSLEYINDPD